MVRLILARSAGPPRGPAASWGIVRRRSLLATDTFPRLLPEPHLDPSPARRSGGCPPPWTRAVDRALRRPPRTGHRAQRALSLGALRALLAAPAQLRARDRQHAFAEVVDVVADRLATRFGYVQDPADGLALSVHDPTRRNTRDPSSAPVSAPKRPRRAASAACTAFQYGSARLDNTGRSSHLA